MGEHLFISVYANAYVSMHMYVYIVQRCVEATEQPQLSLFSCYPPCF